MRSWGMFVVVVVAAGCGGGLPDGGGGDEREPDPDPPPCQTVPEVFGDADNDLVRDICDVDGDVRLSGRRVGTDLVFPRLTHVGGTLEVFEHQGIKALRLPVLESIEGSMQVQANPLLEHLDAPVLVHVGGLLIIADNPALPQCDADAVADVVACDQCNGNGPCATP